MIQIPLTELQPNWVEFTSTKGMLRCLKPNESKSRAQGLVFNCPRCRGNRQKAHYCIFLFDRDDVPKEAKPHGRFLPTFEKGKALIIPSDFKDLTLTTISDVTTVGHTHYHLKPGELKCHWQGELRKGIVSWKPSLVERIWK